MATNPSSLLHVAQSIDPTPCMEQLCMSENGRCEMCASARPGRVRAQVAALQ